MNNFKNYFSGILLLFVSACGGGTGIDNSFLATDSPQPVVIAALPATAQAGDTVIIQGIGFSPVINQNIILVAGTSSTATSYSLVPDPAASNGATDQIEFVLPDQAEVGASSLIVMVGAVSSNSLTFTVESP